jgi:DNA-directed RNA polymerase subunit delta
MMVRRFHLFFSSLIAYCITSICIISINNNNVIVVNAAENEDAVEVDENNAGDGDENNAAAGDAGDVVAVPFMNDEILSCIDSTVAFFIDNPDIENECDQYADTYSQRSQDNLDSDGNEIMVLGYPEESLTALESICSTNNGYWITTTTKLEFTCIVMEFETIKVVVNNYGECLANTKECHNTNISILMEGMFADMDFACYEGDVPPDNFNELVSEIDSNYFKDDDIFGPNGDDEFDDDEFESDDEFDDDYEVDDLFTFDGDDLTAFNDDANDEIMEELKDGLPEENENENEATTTRPPASSSNTVETPPVEEEESSSTLYAGGTGDESRLDSTSTSADSSYSMTGIVVISCIVIATVGFIFTHLHQAKKNKRRTGSGGGKGGRRGGGRHAKLSQQIGYEMTDVSSGENNLQFESSGNLT